MTRKELAIIHILKKELNLTDDDYRTLLWNNYRVESSKSLTTPQYKDLVATLRGMQSGSTLSPTIPNNPQQITTPQKSYITSLAKIGNIRNIPAFITKVIDRPIATLDDLTKKEASRVITILRSYQK